MSFTVIILTNIQETKLPKKSIIMLLMMIISTLIYYHKSLLDWPLHTKWTQVERRKKAIIARIYNAFILDGAMQIHFVSVCMRRIIMRRSDGVGN